MPARESKRVSFREWQERKAAKEVKPTLAERLGDKAKSFFDSTAQAALNGGKRALEKCFDKALEVTGWVAKGAIVASVAATGLTALGACISPTLTLKVVESVALTLGATPKAAVANSVGEVVIIQSQYTGELLALAIKNGVELGAKSAVYTAQAIGSHIIKPIFTGFASVVVNEASNACAWMADGVSSAWAATTSKVSNAWAAIPRFSMGG